MKKLITLCLALAGMVSTASATDYYIGANTKDNGSNWDIQGQMTDDDGDGIYSLIIQVPAKDGNNFTYLYLTVFTSSTIDWNCAYRPVGGEKWFTNNNGGNEIELSDNYELNDKSIVYPNGDTNDANKNFASALKLDFDPDSKILKATRLIAVISSYNNFSTTADYLTETSNGSKKYTGKVVLERESTDSGEDNGFKFYLHENGLTYYGGQGGDGNNYIAKVDNNVNVSADGVYELTADFTNFKWTDPVRVAAPATINSAGYATFSSQYAVDLDEATDVTAYRATLDGTRVKLIKVTGKVAANTGLVLKGTANSTPTIPSTIGGTSYSRSDNYLEASVNATDITVEALSSDYYYFLAGTDSETIGFYQLAQGNYTSKAGKAYLHTTTPLAEEYSNARAIWIFEDETQGINNVESTQNVDVIYDLQGRVAKAAKAGLYIKNGKKVIMK